MLSMRNARAQFLLSMLAAASLLPPLSAASFTIEAGPGPAAAIPKATQALVAAEAVTVKSGDTVVAHFWMRAAAFAGDAVDGFGVRYATIPEGAFLGVVSFPEKGSDFREQSIPSGIYTLRFGLHPENGDHMGVAPSRDFALLSPVDKDLEVEKNYDFDALVELTAEVGNPHPTVARLELPEGDDAPHLWENDYEHWVLDLEVADEVVGIVVYGHAEE